MDGFIFNRVQQSDWRIHYRNEEQIPFISLERSIDHLDYPFFHVENIDSTINLIDYLVSQGFRHIAFIGGPEGLIIHYDRFIGYGEGLAMHDLPFDPSVVSQADLTSSRGYQAAKQLLSLSDPPDAVIVINDKTALGVLHAAYGANISVGDGLAVACVDGVQDARYSQPPPTTFDLRIGEIAHRLVRMLLAESNGEALPKRHIIIQPVPHLRNSTIKRG